MKGIFILLNNWDKRYLDMADIVASWSKDPSTKIGAIAVGKKGQLLAQGYNGFPRGVEAVSYTHLTLPTTPYV